MRLVKDQIANEMLSPMHDETGEMFDIEIWSMIMSNIWDEGERGLSLTYSCWDANVNHRTNNWIGRVV